MLARIVAAAPASVTLTADSNYVMYREAAGRESRPARQTTGEARQSGA